MALFADVTAYGATGDGSTDDTTHVQNAINAVSAAGGGVVYFPAPTAAGANIGTYVIATAGSGVSALTIPSDDIELRLDGGVWLQKKFAVDITMPAVAMSEALLGNYSTSTTPPKIHRFAITGLGKIGASDPTMTGPLLFLYGDDMLIEGVTLDTYTGSEAVWLGGDRNLVRGVQILNADPSVGTGGIRVFGGDGTMIIGSSVQSGGDALQLNPIGFTSYYANLPITRTGWVGCSGSSSVGRFLAAQLNSTTAGPLTSSITDSSYVACHGTANIGRIAVSNLSSSGEVRDVGITDCSVGCYPMLGTLVTTVTSTVTTSLTVLEVPFAVTNVLPTPTIIQVNGEQMVLTLRVPGSAPNTYIYTVTRGYGGVTVPTLYSGNVVLMPYAAPLTGFLTSAITGVGAATFTVTERVPPATQPTVIQIDQELISVPTGGYSSTGVYNGTATYTVAAGNRGYGTTIAATHAVNALVRNIVPALPSSSSGEIVISGTGAPTARALSSVRLTGVRVINPLYTSILIPGGPGMSDIGLDGCETAAGSLDPTKPQLSADALRNLTVRGHRFGPQQATQASIGANTAVTSFTEEGCHHSGVGGTMSTAGFGTDCVNVNRPLIIGTNFDARQIVTDGVIVTGALSTLTSATGLFRVTDVGSVIIVATSGGTVLVTTTIASFVDTMTVTLTAPGTAVTAATVTWYLTFGRAVHLGVGCAAAVVRDNDMASLFYGSTPLFDETTATSPLNTVESANRGDPSEYTLVMTGSQSVSTLTAMDLYLNGTAAPVLGFPVQAGQVWAYDAVVFYTADASSDIKLKVAGPVTGSTYQEHIMGLDPAATTATAGATFTASAGTQVPAGGAGTTTLAARIRGIASIGSTGSLRLQSGINSGTTAATVLANSYFHAVRIPPS